MQDLTVFVELPDKSRRRMLINVMFTMGVFRLGLSKILKVSPDVLRLWLISGDHESLIDLNKDAPANGVVQGSVLQVEQADDKGVFKKVENTLTQSTEARFMQESKRVMQEPPLPSHPQHVAAPSSAAHRPPPAAHHQPPPSPPPRVTSEDEQIKQAINASLAAQTTALEKEEALIMALATANKKMRKMNDDGNCLFHALSDQMPSAGDHIKIRRDVVANMRANPHVYEAFCPYEFDVYLATMAIDGEYGTHLELQSFADLYHVAVFVYSDETPEFPPTVVGEENSERVLHLAFLRGNHYNSVVPLDALEVLHRPNVAAAPAGVECFVCSNKFEDVDLHIAMAHPEIFN